MPLLNPGDQFLELPARLPGDETLTGRDVDARLVDFLAEFLGAWPGAPGLTVVGSPARVQPGWDGIVRDVVGVLSPHTGVVSVPPQQADAVRAAVRTVGRSPRSCHGQWAAPTRVPSPVPSGGRASRCPCPTRASGSP